MQYSGVVSNASSFDFDGKKLWSFQLNNVRAYFRLGTTPPKFEKGAYVEFQGQADAKGNVKVALDSIVIKDSSVAKEQGGLKGFRSAVQSSPSQSSNKEMTSTDFWGDKAIRDIETQKRIEIQSCRNSALQFITILLAQEALSIPAKAKNKTHLLEELLEHYLVEFKERNQGVVPQHGKAEADEVPQVEAPL